MCELLGPTAGAGDEMESDEPPEEHVGRAKPNLFIDLTRYREPVCLPRVLRCADASCLFMQRKQLGNVGSIV